MEENKFNFKKYFYSGLTLFFVLLGTVVSYFIVKNLGNIIVFLQNIFHAISPIIIGIVFAYLFTPVFNFLRNIIIKYLTKIKIADKGKTIIAKTVASITCIAILIFIIMGMIMLVIPNITSSIKELIKTLPNYTYNLDNFIHFLKLDDFSDIIHEHYSRVMQACIYYLNNFLNQYSQSMLTNIFISVYSVLKYVLNFVIGIIAMVYILNIKERIGLQFRKFIVAVFSNSFSHTFLRELDYIHVAFSCFIRGKILDSLIVGILCYIGSLILQIPYPLMVSVVIAITNIIPFFGPFIGAIPCGILIALIDPMKGLWFIIFITILQQLDGNIIGPIILSNHTGVSSFYVLLAILLFGSLFGFVGMVVAVPLWAVVQHFISLSINKCLSKKNLSNNTSLYTQDYVMNLTNENKIDE